MESIALILHLFTAVVWIGGMFFAYLVLRPAATGLEPPQRLALWDRVFAGFFPWVWLAVILLPASGLWIAFRVFGGIGTSPLYVHVMLGLGTLMILLFLHLFFAPYRRFKGAVARADWPAAGEQLVTMRRLVGTNLSLGLLLIVTTGGGRYLIS